MRLLTLSLPEIEAEVKKLDKESKALRKEIYEMSWFMRGALSIDQAFMMDITDREIVSDIISDRLEKTKESGMPLI